MIDEVHDTTVFGDPGRVDDQVVFAGMQRRRDCVHRPHSGERLDQGPRLSEVGPDYVAGPGVPQPSCTVITVTDHPEVDVTGHQHPHQFDAGPAGGTDDHDLTHCVVTSVASTRAASGCSPCHWLRSAAIRSQKESLPVRGSMRRDQK